MLRRMQEQRKRRRALAASGGAHDDGCAIAQRNCRRMQNHEFRTQPEHARIDREHRAPFDCSG